MLNPLSGVWLPSRVLIRRCGFRVTETGLNVKSGQDTFLQWLPCPWRALGGQRGGAGAGSPRPNISAMLSSLSNSGGTLCRR